MVDQADVISILDVLGVDGDRWTQVVTIAREAGEKGWWESHKAMGERQAMYANLEAGAATIREYQQTFVPGLLQTPEFVRARTVTAATLKPMSGTVEGVLAGRGGRQRMLRRPGGPTYEVIVDEVAVHRLTAPPEVVKQQRGPMTANGIYQMIARCGQRYGVDAWPHRFRHHFSHTWLDRGGAEGDLMELNGWSSPQMLRRYGASARSARARRTYDRIMTGRP